MGFGAQLRHARRAHPGAAAAHLSAGRGGGASHRQRRRNSGQPARAAGLRGNPRRRCNWADRPGGQLRFASARQHRRLHRGGERRRQRNWRARQEAARGARRARGAGAGSRPAARRGRSLPQRAQRRSPGSRPAHPHRRGRGAGCAKRRCAGAGLFPQLRPQRLCLRHQRRNLGSALHRRVDSPAEPRHPGPLSARLRSQGFCGGGAAGRKCGGCRNFHHLPRLLRPQRAPPPLLGAQRPRQGESVQGNSAILRCVFLHSRPEARH